MDASVVVAVVSGIGAILAACVGFMGTKKNSIQSAEKDFRDTIVKENKDLRARVDELEEELMQANRRWIKLEAIIIKAGLSIDDPGTEARPRAEGAT
jgi:hypothetical protein